MKFIPIELTVREPVVKQFRALARKAFPKETLAFLIGHDAGTKVEVTELYVPDDVAKHAANDTVRMPQHWFEDAEEFAKEREATVVGDIHSHPLSFAESQHDAGISPSAGDLLSARYIFGICAVRQSENKRRLTTDMRFYGPMLPLRAFVVPDAILKAGV